MHPDSHRKAAARRFGELLTRILAEKRVSKRGLAMQLGMSRSLLILWCKGEALPRLDSARRLAEALVAPRLLELVHEARMRTCPVDGVQFEETGGRPSVYCSGPCSKAGAKGHEY